MTTVCMVVHAEGPGDLGSPVRNVPPGESLMPDEQGPAHVLVQRILTEGGQIPAQAIDFREPLRTQTGVRADGSKLLDARVLDEILVGWFLREPPLIVFLVDADNKPPKQRKALLADALKKNEIIGAVGVAVKEFESWLIADTSALQKILGSRNNPPLKPENLSPGKAKSLLRDWCRSVPNRHPSELRKELASVVELERVAQQCASFREFRSELLDLPLS